MADGMYEVLALIPETSDFTLERAADYCAALTLSSGPASSCSTTKPCGWMEHFVWHGELDPGLSWVKLPKSLQETA